MNIQFCLLNVHYRRKLFAKIARLNSAVLSVLPHYDGFGLSNLDPCLCKATGFI